MKKKSAKNSEKKSPTDLIATLQKRFEAHPSRHPDTQWAAVKAKLHQHPSALRSLEWMESTGGEPDVIGYNEYTGTCCFVDCCLESPAGRRSLCYDREGLESRKENRPVTSAMEFAEKMGVKLLTEEEYRHLQKFGPFDTKTSSWLLTPASIRAQGGAIFGDWRYGQVFIYHNGAQSYYGVRGFRGVLKV